jgi:hypothetical protein
MQQEGNARTLSTPVEPVGQEPLTALPTVVGFSLGIVMFLVAALASWRHRARRQRAFHAAAAAPCRPGRWRAA